MIECETIEGRYRSFWSIPKTKHIMAAKEHEVTNKRNGWNLLNHLVEDQS